MRSDRRWPPVNGWRALQYLSLALWGVTAVVIAVLGPRGPIDDLMIGPALFCFTSLATVAAGRAARLRSLAPRVRRAWRCLTLGHLFLVGSCAGFVAHPGFPGPGDVARLASMPLMLVGLLAMTAEARSRSERLRTVLDVGVVGSGGFMAMWLWSIGPLVSTTGVPPEALGAAMVYPLADIILVFGAAAALLRGGTASTRRPLVIAVLGLVMLVVADLQYATDSVARIVGDREEASAPALQWLSVMTAFCLLACAATEQCAQVAAADAVAAPQRAAAPVAVLPYVAIIGGYALLVGVATSADLYPWGGLVLGAVMLTGLVVTRQVLVLRQNHRLVVTDFLTGLSTRPAVAEILTRSLRLAARSERRAAVLLIDLDGFKEVNDELGHDAGDELLAGFADLLRTAVKRSDAVGRLGGDEFVVVLADIRNPDDAVAVALRLLDGMRRPLTVAGRPIVARASIGIALSRPEDTGRDLLHRADQAMYKAKREATGWSIEGSAGVEEQPPSPPVPVRGDDLSPRSPR